MSKIEYVVAYPMKIAEGVNRVLLVEKDRPEWMKGRWNLVGGKIEPGEDPVTAAERELMEEAGIESVQAGDLCYCPSEIYGRIEGTKSRIWVVVVKVNGTPGTDADPEIKPRAGETEKVFWKDWVIAQDDGRLMPNLRVVIPLVLNGNRGWVIEDDMGHWEDQKMHKVTVLFEGEVAGDILRVPMMVPGFGYRSGWEEEE